MHDSPPHLGGLSAQFSNHLPPWGGFSHTVDDENMCHTCDPAPGTMTPCICRSGHFLSTHTRTVQYPVIIHHHDSSLKIIKTFFSGKIAVHRKTQPSLIGSCMHACMNVCRVDIYQQIFDFGTWRAARRRQNEIDK